MSQLWSRKFSFAIAGRVSMERLCSSSLVSFSSCGGPVDTRPRWVGVALPLPLLYFRFTSRKGGDGPVQHLDRISVGLISFFSAWLAQDFPNFSFFTSFPLRPSAGALVRPDILPCVFDHQAGDRAAVQRLFFYSSSHGGRRSCCPRVLCHEEKGDRCTDAPVIGVPSPPSASPQIP